MLRGTNRSIIEINETGNKYFEKVLIFVKPEFYADPADHLKKEAVDLIAAYRPSPYGIAFCVLCHGLVGEVAHDFRLSI